MDGRASQSSTGDGEIELIGFVPSNSPRKAKPRNFGYGSPSVYSKVMAKQIRRLNYIEGKVESGDWVLTKELSLELKSLEGILEDAKMQFGAKAIAKPAYTEYATQQIKENDYWINKMLGCFLYLLILVAVLFFTGVAP